MKKGKLIVLEAGDGCGKQTQAERLFKKLQADGRTVQQISYPDYQSEGAALVKMYLRGDFGQTAAAVNAYTASTFYAVDRYASYKMKWQAAYEAGGIIIADRYTMSNMVHQLVKIEAAAEQETFLQWLWDLEFTKMGLPVPDEVIFLDLAPQFSDKLLAKRGSSSGGADIHEADAAYLHSCYSAYKFLAKKYDWQTVACVEQGKMRSIEAIHQDIYRIVQAVIDARVV